MYLGLLTFGFREMPGIIGQAAAATPDNRLGRRRFDRPEKSSLFAHDLFFAHGRRIHLQRQRVSRPVEKWASHAG
jgi:hypothetical protein